MKRCSKCGDTKPLNEFHKQGTTKDGHGSYCKVCSIAYAIAYQAANKEKVRATQRRWRAANPEKVRSYQDKAYAKRVAERGEVVTKYKFLAREIERLRESPTEECVEWPFSRKPSGYGQLSYNYKPYNTHRLAFSFHYRYYPKTVRHSCKNKACYNPAHLYPYPVGER